MYRCIYNLHSSFRNLHCFDLVMGLLERKCWVDGSEPSDFHEVHPHFHGFIKCWIGFSCSIMFHHLNKWIFMAYQQIQQAFLAGLCCSKPKGPTRVSGSGTPPAISQWRASGWLSRPWACPMHLDELPFTNPKHALKHRKPSGFKMMMLLSWPQMTTMDSTLLGCVGHIM